MRVLIYRRQQWTFPQLMRLGRQQLDRHGLRDWRFEVQNLSNTCMFPDMGPFCARIAVCVPERHLIALDAEWAHRSRSLRELKNAIWHEIARALVGEVHGHDEVWASKAKQIGCPYQYVTRCVMFAAATAWRKPPKQ